MAQPGIKELPVQTSAPRTAAPVTPPRPGGLQRWRVRLPGLKVKLAMFSVVPRDGAPEKYRALPELSYAGIELDHDKDKQDQAWRKYAAEHKLDPIADRKHYRVRPASGAPQDHLDIEARSPADAFEIFRAYNGITSTTQTPLIEPAPDGE